MQFHDLAIVYSLAMLFSTLIGATVRAEGGILPKEAYLAWAESEAFYSEFEAQIALSQEGGNPVVNFATKGRVLSSPKVFLADVVTTRSGAGVETKSRAAVKGYNPKYMFFLKQGQSKEWVIQAMAQVNDALSLEQADTTVAMEFEPFLKAHYCLYDVPLSQAFSRKDIVVQKVTTTSEDGERRVDVAFTCACTDLNSNLLPLKSGTLTLDPDNGWIIRHAKTVAENHGVSVSQELKTSFRNDGQKFLVPTRVTRRITNKNVVNEDQLTYVSYNRRKIGDDEVSLTTFGLREPPGIQKQGIPIFVWFGGAGLILVVAGLFWRRYRKAAK